METQTHLFNQENNPSQGFMQRNALSIKIVLIGALILLLLIPVLMIRGLITERSATASEAAEEVQQKWSSAQEIVGPYLSIPYYENREETYYENGATKIKTKQVLSNLHILPETLTISGDVTTEALKRGLYEVVVYRTPLELKGKFIVPDDYSTEIAGQKLLTHNASLNIGLTDLRGISEQIEVVWDTDTLLFNPGLPVNSILRSGVSTALNVDHLRPGDEVDFVVRLHLKGSQSLCFAPFGKTTKVYITSNSTTPSFTGSFLPEDREVSETGFQADWKVLHLNRNYPQMFTDTQYTGYDDLALFGVDLLLPVQQYQQSMRSVKYAFLIIILTFVVCFFTEVLQKKNIHPFQYLLIGLALCLFYTLLIAISEHLGFIAAYAIAAVMTIALLTFYIMGVLKIRKTAYTIGGLLALLYLYIFILIQMETYALLAGSIGLFVILAVIMYYSQKINWNNR